MINRELIRIKIVQLTYAYYQNGNRNIDVAEKELLFSLSKAYHLYHYLLALVVAGSISGCATLIRPLKTVGLPNTMYSSLALYFPVIYFNP